MVRFDLSAIQNHVAAGFFTTFLLGLNRSASPPQLPLRDESMERNAFLV